MCVCVCSYAYAELSVGGTSHVGGVDEEDEFGGMQEEIEMGTDNGKYAHAPITTESAKFTVDDDDEALPTNSDQI